MKSPIVCVNYTRNILLVSIQITIFYNIIKETEQTLVEVKKLLYY